MLPSIRTLSVAAAVFILFASGCHTPLSVKQMQAKNPWAKNAPKTPTEVVNVWNSYAQTTPEGKTMRGIAGQLHFYGDQKSKQAIKVDGNVTVYVFDGSENDPAHTKPLKVFRFDADSLNKHYSYNKSLGHGYSFFLPMDEIGGLEQALSVVVRFDNRLENTFFASTPVNTLLAGRRKPIPTDPTVREFLDSRSILAATNQQYMAPFDQNIQQTGYVDVMPSAVPEKRVPEKSRVTTIPLNEDMARRLSIMEE